MSASLPDTVTELGHNAWRLSRSQEERGCTRSQLHPHRRAILLCVNTRPPRRFVQIATNLVIFLGFYAAALINRRRPDWHKRLVIIAAATVISAATWRLWVGAFGFHDWAMPAARASTMIFIVAGILHGPAIRRVAHPAWWIGLVVSGGLAAARFMVVGTPLEPPVLQAIARFADLFGWMD